MASTLFIVNSLLLYSPLISMRTFSPVLDCNNHPGCPGETPFLVASLSEQLGSAENVPREVLCAFLCQMNEECVSFNQLPNDECHMFRTLPYKIVEGSSCKFYKINNLCDERCAKTDVFNTTNLAYHRPTCQSSTYMWNDHPLFSWLAVDGLNGTDALQYECSHTNSVAGLTSWFMVELSVMALVNEIKVLIRAANIMTNSLRILNLTVGVTNESWPLKQPITNYYSLCGYYEGPPVSAQWISINCSLPIPPSRFVVIHHGVPDGNLCICEILVFGSSFLNC